LGRVRTSSVSHVEVAEAGEATIVELVGEFDLEATGALARELGEPINRERDLVVDVTRAGLIDSTSLGALITAERRTSFRGRRFALVVGPATAQGVRHALRLTGLLRTSELYPSVDRALAAIVRPAAGDPPS
jgi:anti-anti-sigma factor